MLNNEQLARSYRTDSDSALLTGFMFRFPDSDASSNYTISDDPARLPLAGLTLLDASLKRAFDIVFATTFLLVALPALIILAIALQIDSPGPLFFIQKRIGLSGRSFACIKFRTMHVNAGELLSQILATSPAARREWEADHKLRDDPRVSRLGRLVRKLSLDELPQLYNILVGEMSVVGPRPIVEAEIVKYGIHFSDYSALKPGLTGLWQVSGRNDVSYAERVQLDCEYRRRASFLFDMQIVTKTIPAVLLANGSY